MSIWRYTITEFSFTRAGVTQDLAFESGSLNLERTGNGRDVLSFNLVTDRRGTAVTRLRKRDRVDFVIDLGPDGEYAFRGLVWTTKETHVFEHTGIRQAITCVDYGKLTERVYINTPVPSQLLEDDMALAIANMAWHGITISGDQGSPSTPLPEMAWEFYSIKQALETLASLSGWNIFWDGQTVELRDPFLIAAPFDIDDVEPNWKSIEVSDSLDDYFNNGFLRYGPVGPQLMTYTLTATENGQITFPLPEALVIVSGFVTPTGYLIVNRGGAIANENVDAIGYPGYGAAQWHFDQSQNAFTQNTGASVAVNTGDTIEVTAVFRFPGAVFAVDEAEYADFGPFTFVVNEPTITNKADAQNRLNALLQRFTGDDERINVTLDRIGLSPFQALTVNVDDHVLDDEYLVLRTRTTHIEASPMPNGDLVHVFEQVAECVKGNQYRRNWEEFFRPNTDVPGTTSFGIIPPVTPLASEGCTGQPVLHQAFWEGGSPDSEWIADAPSNLELLPTGGIGGSQAVHRIDPAGIDIARITLEKIAPEHNSGCVEFYFKSDGGTAPASPSLWGSWNNSLGLGGSGNAPYIAFERQVGELGSLTASWLNNGSNTTVFQWQSTAPLFSTQSFNRFRVEYKLSTYAGGIYTNDAYVRLYKDGILIVGHTGMIWHSGDASPNRGFDAERLAVPGTIDSFIQKGFAGAGSSVSASISPSGSASSTPSSSASSSVSPSAGSSPSPSVSPSSSPSPSVSSSVSQSVSPSASGSASQSPSSSPSRSASPSVSPSSSASRSASPSVSPSSSASRSVSPSASVSPSSSVSASASAGFPAQVGRTGPINVNVATTSHPITLPAGVNVGELLLVTFTCDGAPTLTITTGSGWNVIGPTAQGSNVTGAIYWKIADGTDALTIGTSTSQDSSHRCRRYNTTSNTATTVTGTSTTAAATPNGNAPAHTPPGGADDYLWVVTYHGDGTTPSAAPTNYTDLSTAFNSGGRSVSYAERELNASSEDPGAWTCVITNLVMFTLAIEPA
jgi:hypothetical protein